jgi:non-ribosomal peptide synthetase component E (peptide arylation enzyme)
VWVIGLIAVEICGAHGNDRSAAWRFEVESALLLHPAVMESAAIAVPDEVRAG